MIVIDKEKYINLLEKNLDILNESINDKNIFKIIFFCGSPGAGKTTTCDFMFKNNLEVKIADVDDIDNYGMYKFMILSNPTKKVDLFKILKVKKQIEQGILKTPKDYWNSEDRNEYRIFANSLLRKRNLNWINSMLPTVYMGIGLNYERIKKQKAVFESIGFDTYMIYVGCSLDTALERNKKRNRSEPDNIIIDDHHKYENLLDSYRNIFKDNFFEIRNESDTSLQNLQNRADWVYNKIMDNRIHNKLGIEICKEMKEKHYKYLSDFFTNFVKFYDKHF